MYISIYIYYAHLYIYPLSEPINLFGHIGSISTKKWQILCTSCTSPKKVNKKKDSPSGATYPQKNYLIQWIQWIQSLVSHISWFFCVMSLPAASSLRYNSFLFESLSQKVRMRASKWRWCVVCSAFSLKRNSQPTDLTRYHKVEIRMNIPRR